MVDVNFKKKYEVAENLASSLSREPDVLAVLLVGSVARRISTRESDVDIAVFIDNYDGSQFTGNMHISGEQVGIEKYNANKFLIWPKTPLLNQKELREAGRFAQGIVLYSKWPQLNDVTRKWKSALLEPNAAHNLFSIASRNLHRGNTIHLSVVDRVWDLVGAAFTLALIALYLSPVRFHKLKWVLNDLRKTEYSTLADEITATIIGSRNDFYSIETIITPWKEQLYSACILGNLPLFITSSYGSHNYNIVRENICEAEKFFHSGDSHSATYVAISCIYLVNRLIFETLIESSLETELNALSAWRRETLWRLLPEEVFENCFCDHLYTELVKVGIELQEAYKGMVICL